MMVSLVAGALPASAQSPLNIDGKQRETSSFPKTPGGMFGPKPKLDKTQPLHLQGDQLIYDTKGNRVIARGNVEIFYNNNILTADEVVYDQSANTLSASGNVELKESNGNIVRADRYTLTDDFRDGFVQSLSIVTRDQSRISAERAVRREGNVTEFQNGRFTACKPKEGQAPLWCIGAKKIIHDQSAATITYQDATFELFGVPVFYLPYFQHADPSVKRKSGFLIPNYGSSGDLGSIFETPYFFNLAPNYDLLFHPAYLTKQGILWQGDWRQRLANGQYTVKLAGIDQDGDDLPSGVLSDSRREELDGWRGSVETKGEFSLGSWWKAGWDLTYESDDTFRRFYKLDSILLTERVNKIFLEGISERNYLGIYGYDLRGLNRADTAQAEAIVHPVIDHNYIFEQPLLGGELSMNNNAYSLSRDDADNISHRTQSVTKVTSEFKWRRKMTDAVGISYTPFAEARGDVYQLNDYFDPLDEDIRGNDTVVRGVATGGATISYPWVANTASASHVIEPIGQIVARQADITQDRLPNEDAKSIVFDDTNLFDTDKFSGYDRIETGTRANVGVQYTFQSNTGGYARVLAGQSFHLAGENAFRRPGFDPDGVPVISPLNGLQDDSSDYVLGVYLAPTSYFRFISQARFDDDSLELRRADTSARLQFGALTAQATHSFQDAGLYDNVLGLPVDPTNLQDQQDIVGSAGLKLSDNWTIFGAMRYDLDDGRRLTDSVQLRYGDECFALSLTYNETFITDVTRELQPDQTVMVRFEFKNLGEYKYKTDVLDHNYGTDDQPN